MTHYVLITSLIIVLLTNPTLQAAAPEIQGDVITDISLDSITNAAIADGASAQIIIGSFLEGKTFGDFRATVSAGVVTNAAAAISW